jgi:UDPglucose 6-dehydrogenase
MTTISVVGLGKLGLPIAASFAHRGFDVVGIDIDEWLVDRINNGEAPWYERGLQELIDVHIGLELNCCTDHSKAIKDTFATLVIVDTPSKSDGSFSNNSLLSAVTSLGKAFANSRKDYHLFIIGSTVMPGTVRALSSVLRDVSGDREFDICYVPETVALGSVIADFLDPDVVFLGADNEYADKLVSDIYGKLCGYKSQRHMSVASAEMAKICLNNFLTMKISFANMIGNVCEKVGADARDVLSAVARDTRVSPKFFKAGVAYGGTCFPRDTGALTSIAELHGVNSKLVHATEDINEEQTGLLIAKIRRELNGGKLGIVGMSFKQGTGVTVESPSFEVWNAFPDAVCYDPLISEFVGNWENCLQCDVIVLMHNTSYSITGWIDQDEEKVIIDPWHTLDSLEFSGNIKVVT